MTALRGHIPASAEPRAIGVHSPDHFTLQVPDLAAAERFYASFGLDVRPDGNALVLRAFGQDQRWGIVVEGPRKQLHHISFACYSNDLEALKRRAEAAGVRLVDAPAAFESNGFWFRDHAGLLLEIKVGPKTSPNHKSSGTWSSCSEGIAGAPVRAAAPLVRPRRLAHVLSFTTDIDAAIQFYSKTLGLRLSDRSNLVAFMHAIHGSDHHVLAFAQSTAPGMHHCSWDVAGIDDVGPGATSMADKGYQKGWGLGRHVLGSNYFHYVQDPWGSFAEYSCDIDYVPADKVWPARHHADEDAFYLWGPEPPADFAVNHEAGVS